MILDFILSQVDRAIDLTASGTDVRGQGKAEMRAAAVGLVIEGALRITDSSGEFYFDFEPALKTVLKTIAARLTDPFRQNGVWPAEVETLVIQELLSNSATEDRTETLVRSLSPGAHGQLFNLAAEDVVIPSQIELVARSRRSLTRSMIAEVLRVDFEIGVDGTPRFGLVPTLERTVYGTLPRIANSIESIEDHVINGPNGGGSGPGPAPAPGGGGTDPENPNINPHNINAFYGAVVGPGGGFTRDSGCASWMRQVLKNGGITNPQSLSDLARYLADVPEQERREKFVGEMLAAAQDFPGLPQKLNADELAAIFDGALAVYDRLTNT